MSTKKIREALARFNTMNLNRGGGDAVVTASIAGALDEVRAIERAAKAMNEATLDREKLRATALLMKSIAKDAP